MKHRNSRQLERREGDSNPRSQFTRDADLANRCIRPLCHLSGVCYRNELRQFCNYPKCRRLHTQRRPPSGIKPRVTVPVEVTTDRQLALAMRWLVDLADARKGIPMKEALAAEIMDAFQGQGNAIRKRDEVHKMAQANKAFAHFRW